VRTAGFGDLAFAKGGLDFGRERDGGQREGRRRAMARGCSWLLLILRALGVKSTSRTRGAHERAPTMEGALFVRSDWCIFVACTTRDAASPRRLPPTSRRAVYNTTRAGARGGHWTTYTSRAVGVDGHCIRLALAS